MPLVDPLTIGLALREEEPSVTAFQRERAGEFLWPRDRDYFATLVDGRNLYVARAGDRIVGMCYVVPGERADEEWEFGGVLVDEELRGRGIAAALGRYALSISYVFDAPHEVIAHVHQDNDAPRTVLTEALGFELTKRTAIPQDPPASMRRNEEGFVIGDVFEFRESSLHGFARWFSDFAGSIEGRNDERTGVSFLVPNWDEFIEDLYAAAEARASR